MRQKFQLFGIYSAMLRDTVGCEHQGEHPLIPILENLYIPFESHKFVDVNGKLKKSKIGNFEVFCAKGNEKWKGLKNDSKASIDQIREVHETDFRRDRYGKPIRFGTLRRHEAFKCLDKLKKCLLDYDFSNFPMRGAIVKIGDDYWLALADWQLIPRKDSERIQFKRKKFWKNSKRIQFKRKKFREGFKRTQFIMLNPKQITIRTFDSARVENIEKLVGETEVIEINQMLISLIELSIQKIYLNN